MTELITFDPCRLKAKLQTRFQTLCGDEWMRFQFAPVNTPSLCTPRCFWHFVLHSFTTKSSSNRQRQVRLGACQSVKRETRAERDTLNGSFFQPGKQSGAMK
jgi:hypothetical protein